MIDEKIVDLFENYGYSEYLFEINKVKNELDKRHINETHPVKSIDNSYIGEYSYYLLQNALYRSRMLINSWYVLLNTEEVISCSILTRAHMEVTGLLCYYLKKLEQYRNGSLSVDELRKLSLKFTMGTRMDVDGVELPSSYNAQTYVREVDKRYNKINKVKDSIFEDIYNELSEIAHPNLEGLTFGSEMDDDFKVTFSYSPKLNDRRVKLLSYMCVTAEIFLELYDEIYLILEKYEELPKIFK